MDCSERGRSLHRLLDGELSDGESWEVGEHLRECSACRKSLAELQALAGALARLTAPEPPAGLARSTLKAFRTQKARNSIRQWWGTLGFGLRTAACAISLLGFVLGIFSGASITRDNAAIAAVEEDVYVALVDPGEGGLP